MRNYKLSGAIRRENKSINNISSFIQRIKHSGRPINGDTLSDTISDMVNDGELRRGDDNHAILDGVRAEFDADELPRKEENYWGYKRDENGKVYKDATNSISQHIKALQVDAETVSPHDPYKACPPSEIHKLDAKLSRQIFGTDTLTIITQVPVISEVEVRAGLNIVEFIGNGLQLKDLEDVKVDYVGESAIHQCTIQNTYALVYLQLFIEALGEGGITSFHFNIDGEENALIELAYA